MVDFRSTLTFPLEYFEAVMHNFYDNYHVDGFRFDCVSEFLSGYASVVQKASDLVTQNRWSRFKNTQPILAAEYLADAHPPEYILMQTKSNCCVQNNTFDVCTRLAAGLKNGDSNVISSNISYLGQSNLSNSWYPSGKPPFANIESHDHMRFVCNFFDSIEPSDEDLLFGNYEWNYDQRGKYWFKVQPFLIGVILSRGIPFIWQGEELVENYFVNENIKDISRVKLLRDVHWEYFFDNSGRTVHDLVKLLIQIRKQYKTLFIDGGYNYIDSEQHRAQQVLAFERYTADANAYVVLNFSNTNLNKTNRNAVVMPQNLDGYWDLIMNTGTGAGKEIDVNGNYGSVLIKKAG